MLVENFVPGKLAEIGLGWEDCRKINERLIYASISGAYFLHFFFRGVPELVKLFSGYGQTGPFAKNAGYDVVIEAEAGLMHMCVTLSI